MPITAEEDEMSGSSSSSSSSMSCLCPVHEKCLQDRVQLCMRAGVVQTRCARCWTVLWVQRKRAAVVVEVVSSIENFLLHEEEEARGAPSSKRQRLV